MRIHNECSFMKQDGISKIENVYNAKFVMESCIRSADGGWCNFPAAIFYTEETHPKGSNYFALYRDEYGRIMITNGISATDDFLGLKIGEDVIYSRYRHDYRTFENAFVDGGRDYFRHRGDLGTPVKLKVIDDHLEVVE